MKISKENIGWDAFVFAAYCAMAPLNMIMNYSGGGTINKYVGILAAVCMLVQIAIKNKFAVNRGVVLVTGFFAWALTTILWTVASGITQSLLITLGSLVAVFVVGAMRGFNSRELSMIKHIMVIVSAVLVFWISPQQDQNYYRGTLSNEAGVADQNGLAANVLFALWMAIDLMMNAKGKKKLLYMAAALSMGISIIMMASRGALVAFFVSALVYFFMRRKELKPIAVVGIVVAIFALLAYYEKTNPGLMSRLSLESTKADGGNGRVEVWSATLDLLLNHPLRLLFGYGYGAETEISFRAMRMAIGTHNVYIEHLATMGAIGFILLLWILLMILRKAIRGRDYLAIALMISMMTVSMFLGFFRDKGAWNMLLLCFVGFVNSRNSNEKGSENTGLDS